MRENLEISDIILVAVDIMKKCFGGTRVTLLSKEMYRLPPTEFAPAGKVAVDIEIDGVWAILEYSTASEMLEPYGQMVAEEVVFEMVTMVCPNKFFTV